MEVAAGAKAETLGSRALEDLGVGLDLDRQRFVAGFGIDDDGAGSEVTVLDGRDAAYDLDRFDVVGRYLADVDAGVRQRTCRGRG